MHPVDRHTWINAFSLLINIYPTFKKKKKRASDRQATQNDKEINKNVCGRLHFPKIVAAISSGPHVPFPARRWHPFNYRERPCLLPVKLVGWVSLLRSLEYMAEEIL